MPMPAQLQADLCPLTGDAMARTGRAVTTLQVTNIGDHTVAVGARFHFAETNQMLDFDRAAARGMRLDIAAGTQLRFAPGQTRVVALVAAGPLRPTPRRG